MMDNIAKIVLRLNAWRLAHVPTTRTKLNAAYALLLAKYNFLLVNYIQYNIYVYLIWFGQTFWITQRLSLTFYRNAFLPEFGMLVCLNYNKTILFFYHFTCKIYFLKCNFIFIYKINSL